MNQQMSHNAEKPAIVLPLTRVEAAALLAAITQYIVFAKEHPQISNQAMLEHLDDIARELGEQARTPMLHPWCVQGIQHLMTLNRHALRHEPYSEQHMLAQTWLRTHNVPVYIDSNLEIWRLGTSIGADGVVDR